MAMICIDGGHECTGCMHCNDNTEERIGTCDACSDPIYKSDDYYDIDGVLLHEDCLTDWAAQYKK